MRIEFTEKVHRNLFQRYTIIENKVSYPTNVLKQIYYQSYLALEKLEKIKSEFKNEIEK